MHLLCTESSVWKNDRITKDALGRPNGHRYQATSAQVEALLDHVRTYRSPHVDLRPRVRRVERRLLDEYAGFLVGNQCRDFGKQDGVTEMEESVTANAVERKLNDALFEDEEGGKVNVDRRPVFVSW